MSILNASPAPWPRRKAQCTVARPEHAANKKMDATRSKSRLGGIEQRIKRRPPFSDKNGLSYVLNMSLISCPSFVPDRLPIASGRVQWCYLCGWTESGLSRAGVFATKSKDSVLISCRPRRLDLEANTLENLPFFVSVRIASRSIFLLPFFFSVAITRGAVVPRDQHRPRSGSVAALLLLPHSSATSRSSSYAVLTRPLNLPGVMIV